LAAACIGAAEEPVGCFAFSAALLDIHPGALQPALEHSA
jgi:hypothetical protein